MVPKTIFRLGSRLRKQYYTLSCRGMHLDRAGSEGRAQREATQKVRRHVERAATNNFFYAPTASIYGGVGGLFDYGPMGCKLKANMLAHWRHHFVFEEDMLEVECAAMTPEKVLQTSGHVDKFEDIMVKDAKTNECYRADHLLEEFIDKLLEDPELTKDRVKELTVLRGKADALSIDELTTIFKEMGIKSPETGNNLSDPYPFNLMFASPIGPTGKLQGYLRPE
eukprot:867297_1